MKKYLKQYTITQIEKQYKNKIERKRKNINKQMERKLEFIHKIKYKGIDNSKK